MEIAYWAGSNQPWSDALDRSRWAEEAGWCGIWVPDHFMPPTGGYGNEPDPDNPELAPVHEAFALQAALAAAVPRVRIGAMVASTTYRHPAVLANAAVTIDHISGGRFVLGLGAGWQQNEHEHYGLELGTPRQRSDRLAEACEVIASLLTQERTSFAGDYYTLVDAPLEPKPVRGHLPLMIGGGGEQRTLRTVARWADEWNVWGPPAHLEQKIGVLAERCNEAGRDITEIRTSACAALWICADEVESAKRRRRLGQQGGLVGTPDELRAALGEYRRIGLAELIVPDFVFPSDTVMPMFERFQTEILGR